MAAQAKQISDRMTKSDVDSAISTATEALKTSIGGKSFDNIVIGGNVEKVKRVVIYKYHIP
ncbi:hypothetical protein OCUAc20_33100 [Acinetobacter baumannii]|nr:hypothetical protein OCUAc20_33100 [Acinetobacter baumannii]